MKTVFLSASLLAAAAAQAVPQIEVLSSSSQDKSRLVTVDFTLDAPAVVTADVCTNRGDGVYVTIGLANFANLTGPLNRLTDGGTYRATWQPVDSWPSNKVENLRVVLKAWAPENPPPYMVVDLTDKTTPAEDYTCAEAVPGGVTARIYKTDKMVFRKIDAAGRSFTCGASPADRAAFSSGGEYDASYAPREVAHRVNMTEDFYLAIYETTQQQYAHVCVNNNRGGSWPSGYQGEAYPNAAVMPVEKLAYTGSDTRTDYSFSMHYKLYGYINIETRAGQEPTSTSVIGQFRAVSGMAMDLPTDAQWEYACRAGCPWPFYDWGPNPVAIAWCKACDPAPTCPQEVGTKDPNAWGLYDMLGNVSEMTRTIWATPTSADAVDPTESTGGTQFCVRGGAWNSDAIKQCRSAYRTALGTGWNYSTTVDIGFRLSCPAVAVK